MTQYVTNAAANAANGNLNNVNAKNGSSSNTATMLGCRIAGTPTYIPAHIKPGAQKTTQAQCRFNVFQNIRGRELIFAITAWGKMADICAKAAATGKEVEIISTIDSFRGKVWLPTPDGQPRQHVQLADGTPLMINKVGFTIDKLRWGADSMKTVQEEIQQQRRPVGWNDPTQAGYQQWREICMNWNAQKYQHGQGMFGYARVMLPIQGSQIVDTTVAAQAQTGAAQQYVAQPAAVAAAMPAQPAAAAQPVQPVAAAATAPAQPVMVNGQEMGYAAPAQPAAPVQTVAAPVQTVAAQPAAVAPVNECAPIVM